MVKLTSWIEQPSFAKRCTREWQRTLMTRFRSAHANRWSSRRRTKENRRHAAPRNTWKISQKRISTDNAAQAHWGSCIRIPMYILRLNVEIGPPTYHLQVLCTKKGTIRGTIDKERAEEAEKGSKEETATEPI